MIKRDLYYDRIPTKSLREDVRYLGFVLGKVIKDQEGETFFKLVEKIRKLSKTNKFNSNSDKSKKNISRILIKLDPKKTFKITRAFTHFMNLLNLAEMVDASRNLDDYENKKKINNKNIFIEEIFEKLFKNKKISNNKIYDFAKKLNIGIVLTAHPTEVKRRTLIQKYHHITEILEQRDLFKNFPSKTAKLDKKLYDELTVIWNTDDLKRFKPSPFERQDGVWQL